MKIPNARSKGAPMMSPTANPAVPPRLNPELICAGPGDFMGAAVEGDAIGVDAWEFVAVFETEDDEDDEEDVEKDDDDEIDAVVERVVKAEDPRLILNLLLPNSAVVLPGLKMQKLKEAPAMLLVLPTIQG